MSGGAHFKVTVVSGLLVLVAAFASHCQARMFTTCSGMCSDDSPCGESYDDCVTRCSALEDKCDRVGHPAAFLAYLTCTIDAALSCDDAGQPVPSALCEQSQADLLQCDSEGDAALEIPDGAYDADTPCADAGDCVACCTDHHADGARKYAALVTDCLCQSSTCESACSTEACRGDAQMQPQPNDSCDRCITTKLDNSTPDAGVCVLPVTLQCNRSTDCALFVNCSTQAGCAP